MTVAIMDGVCLLKYELATRVPGAEIVWATTTGLQNGANLYYKVVTDGTALGASLTSEVGKQRFQTSTPQ